MNYSQFGETDWHVMAQDIAHNWSKPEEAAVAYQAAAEALRIFRAEMQRRDDNETRNCINWGPCSHNNGGMSETSWIASADTHPKGGDGEAAPFMSGAVGEAETPKSNYSEIPNSCPINPTEDQTPIA